MFTSCAKSVDNVQEGGEENSSVTFAISVEGMRMNEIRGSYADNLTEPASQIKSLRIMMFDYNSGELEVDYTLDYIDGQSQITRQLPYKGLTAGVTLKKHIVALANIRGESQSISVDFPAAGIKRYDDIKNITVTLRGAIDGSDKLMPMAAQSDPTQGIEIQMGSNEISLTLERLVSRFGFTNVTPPGTDAVTGAVIPAKNIFTATRIEMSNYATSYRLFDSSVAPTLSSTAMSITLGDDENTVFYMLPTPRNASGRGLAVTVYGKANESVTENVSKKFEIALMPIGLFNGTIARNCAYAMYVEYKREITWESRPVSKSSIADAKYFIEAPKVD